MVVDASLIHTANAFLDFLDSSVKWSMETVSDLLENIKLMKKLINTTIYFSHYSL